MIDTIPPDAALPTTPSAEPVLAAGTGVARTGKVAVSLPFCTVKFEI